jgi:hypothetical protein
MNAQNYHRGIQKKAQGIISSRKTTYVRGGNKPIVWNEREQCYLYGAIYKLLRVKNEMSDLDKAEDDVVDAYNYMALFFEQLQKRRI